MNYSAKLQSYFRENSSLSAETISIPPFTLFLHKTDKNAMANVAIPEKPFGGDIRGSLQQIESICASHRCKAHIHFLNAYAPDLATTLQENGYTETEKWPVLICTPQSYLSAALVPGLQIVTISRESTLDEAKEGWNANALGYDLNAALATDEEAEAFRNSLDGCRGFTARLHGQAVGAGMFNPLHEKVTELVGITTLAPFRRQGIASYLTAFATQAAFDLGVEMVCLIPENPESQRIYERVGYSLYASLLSYHVEGVGE